MPTTAYATKSAQFVESALRQVGIKVTVEELDFATWLKDVHNGGNYDMSIVAHVEARDLRRFTDPTYYFPTTTTPGTTSSSRPPTRRPPTNSCR